MAEARSETSVPPTKPLLVLGDPTEPYQFQDREFVAASVDEIAAYSEEYNWDFAEYFSTLTTSRLGRSLIFADSISSTQDFVRQNGKNMPDGAACIANFQTSGHGRRTNTWTSPRGCLLFTFVKHFDPEVGKFLPLFQYLIGLAVVEAVGDSPQKLDLRIKWPNDIYTTNKIKIGGALCETQFRSDLLVVCGVGLNVSNTTPTTCLNELLEQRAEVPNGASNHPFSREFVLASIFNALEPMFAPFASDGFEPFKERYLVSWIHLDQELILKTEGSDAESKRVRVVEIDASTGSLISLDEEGTQLTLHPDLSSLDLFAGLLISKK